MQRFPYDTLAVIVIPPCQQMYSIKHAQSHPHGPQKTANSAGAAASVHDRSARIWLRSKLGGSTAESLTCGRELPFSSKHTRYESW
jgi:hypothetical protein